MNKMQHIKESFIYRFKTGKWIGPIARYAILILLSYQLLYPVLYMISASIKAPIDSYDPSVIWIPKHFSATGFTDAFKTMKYMDALLRSLGIGLGCALLDVASCALAGYGFARFKFPLKNVFFVCVILTLIVPTQTIILPYYMNMRYFDPLGIMTLFSGITGSETMINLIGNNLAFFIPSALGAGIRSGLYIYIFRQFFEGMSAALEESAYVDGSGPLRTFTHIMLPNAKNAIVTVFLFSFVWHFNDYYLSKQLLGTDKRTLIVALSSLRMDLAAVIGGQTEFDPIRVQTRIQAGCLLVILPMFLLYIVTQRKLADSIEHIGIK
ncbi:MAG: carbohydrate ABC transporter permease [Lachnospiraceae bacterium]|nr:carbohydrate ABC transporter permease [Lachnospiraceae bacterium]